VFIVRIVMISTYDLAGRVAAALAFTCSMVLVGITLACADLLDAARTGDVVGVVHTLETDAGALG